MPYSRRPGQSYVDLAAAKEFEDIVRHHLPDFTISQTNSTEKLDFFVPGITVEVKEKRQKLTDRWFDGTEASFEPDLFIIDELTIRKALTHWPFVWFVLRSVPGEWIRVAHVAEILSADRVRFDRNGKGKWVVDTSEFRNTAIQDLQIAIKTDIASMPWKLSSCVVSAPEV